jgi:hypothetical protein
MTLTLESARLPLLVVTFAASVLTVGCGGGNVLQSPTGPSGTANSETFATSSVAGGASSASSGDVFDTLDKGGNPGGKKPRDAGEAEHGKEPGEAGDHGRGHDDRVVGFVSAKFANTLTVNGVTVAGGPGVVIRHGNRTLTMADIQVGDHVQARGTMDGTTLVATEIKVEDTGNDNDGNENEAELRGTVSAFSGAATCPAATFTIGTTKVTTSATTVFDDVSCATLANGAIVEVDGTTQADGSILATKVEGEAGPDEVEGMIFALAGTASCPALTFKVGSTLATATTVNTNASTTFNGVACTALADGARVEVEGTKQADGSITAASIELH